jgi:hypothetical protein
LDEQTWVDTRRSLHGVAELLIAGPQYREHGTIRLRVTSGGFGGPASPIRVDGSELVWPGGVTRLAGTCADLAATVGVRAEAPGIYADDSGLTPDAPLSVDPVAAVVLADWLGRGDAALRAFAPDAEPVLWPEHFDLAITVDEVNYGVSPGDAGHPRPYAYVGPWSPPSPEPGGFWNAPFGALRPAEALTSVESVLDFFTEGRDAARAA